MNSNEKNIKPTGLFDKARKEIPHWANHKIQVWDENKYRLLEPFVTQDYWTDQGSINVFRVVGTQHWDYQGKTWLEFLETGKRMDINLALHEKKSGLLSRNQSKKTHDVLLDPGWIKLLYRR